MHFYAKFMTPSTAMESDEVDDFGLPAEVLVREGLLDGVLLPLNRFPVWFDGREPQQMALKDGAYSKAPALKELVQDMKGFVYLPRLAP